MNEISSPIPILEFGSTHLRLAIYDKLILDRSLFYDKKIEYIRKENKSEQHPLFDLIVKAENDIGQHLNEIILVIDSSTIQSIDFSIKKNFENKIITDADIEYLVNESSQIIQTFNREREILHVLKSNIFFDDRVVNKYENISGEIKNVIVDLKFITIDKNYINNIKELLLKKHISLKSIYCASFIKSLDLIKKLEISNYISFIDIGFKKSSLLIFKDKKLLHLSSINIGGDHITKDVSKVLKLDYRKAEAEKLKFSRINKINEIDKKKLLKNVINARLEEIIELLFLNSTLLKSDKFGNSLKLYFIGQGSKVLRDNLLSFGSEFNFINEMSIIDENHKDCCESAIKYANYYGQKQLKKNKISLENKGFFERLFEYFSN